MKLHKGHLYILYKNRIYQYVGDYYEGSADFIYHVFIIGDIHNEDSYCFVPSSHVDIHIREIIVPKYDFT